ncbi:hypothetical protein M3Y97_00414900 [Aphelenchoides bicaudatus]|nr:hypothetical protein M3Y97_00414900 [Aphelenchoides bicaudatus]
MNNGDSHDAEVEQEPNGSSHQSGGNDDSQASKTALTPRTLFGGSATLLKEADLNSLKANALDELETEAAIAQEDESLAAEEKMEVETQQELIDLEPSAQNEESIEDEPEILELADQPNEGDLIMDDEPEIQEVEPVVEEVKEPKSSRSRRSKIEEPVVEKPAEEASTSEKRSSRRSTQKAELPPVEKLETPRQSRARQSTKQEPEKAPASSGRSTRQKKAEAPVEEVVEIADDEPTETIKEEPKSGRRSTRQKKAETPVKSTTDEANEPVEEEEPKSGRRSLRAKKPIEKVETPAKTPVATSRKSAAKKPDAVEQEEEIKMPETIRRNLRTPAKQNDAPAEEPKSSARASRARKVSEKPAVSAPVPSKSATRSAKKAESPVVDNEESEESEQEESDEESLDKSPISKKSRQSKQTDKGNTSSAGTSKSSKKPTPARSRKSKKSDVKINTDASDPFNFDMQLNNHPEPLGNIKVNKGNFGEMKFTRSPIKDIEKRYANTEKAAAMNLSPMMPKLASADRPTIMSLSTTTDVQNDVKPSSSKSGKGRKRAQKSATPDIFEPTAEKTPRRIKLVSKPKPTPKAAAKPEPKELSPEEQVKADFTEEPHPAGTRLYALWGTDFYPAFVLNERDGLGRYKVIYAEDGATRDIPLTGIITLSKLQVGSEVAINKEEGLLQPVKITRLPNKDDPNEWKEGVYDAEELDEDGQGNQRIASHSWKDFFISKLQQKDIVGNILNQSVNVDTSNAVPRSARRSRIAATATIHETIHPQLRQSTSAKKTHEPNADVKTPMKATPKKRSRKVEPSNGDDELETPAKRRAVQGSTEANDEQEMETEEVDSNVNINLFSNCYFILTSSARKTSATHFNKREYKDLVEKFGGTIVEDTAELDEMNEGGKAFLIADGYYRTQKYLFALASSIPCLHFTWLKQCVEKNELVDYEEYLLKAGCSVVDNQEYPWAPLKGNLFKDKTIFVYAANVDQPASNSVQFAEIWKPLLNLLGAEVLTCDEMDVDKVVEFAKNTEYDFLLTDRTCDEKVLACVDEDKTVSSNWVIHAVVVNELVPATTHPSFSPREQ